jgi:AIG2-like family.
MIFNRQAKIDDWFERLVAGVKWTPDIALLEEKAAHLLFICDDLKQQHRRHGLLRDQRFLAEAFTRKPMSMWTRNLGKLSHPVPFDDKSLIAPYSVVQGELHLVNTEQLCSLDRYRMNGVEFDRVRLHVKVPYMKAWLDKELKPKFSGIIHETVECWMYIGVKEYWYPLLDAKGGGILFSPTTTHFFDKGIGDEGKFYQFSSRDYFGGNGAEWLKENRKDNFAVATYLVEKEKTIANLREYGKELETLNRKRR